MAKPKNTRPQPGYGDLNQIQRPDMAIDFDPTNTSFLGTLRKQAAQRFSFDAFKGVGNFYGIVLRVDGRINKSGANPLSFFSFGESAGMLQLKVRIPEIHAHLPEPDLFGNTPIGPHQYIIDLYPTFVAASEDISNDVPAVGDIVRVDFADRVNQTQPLYLGKYAKGPGSAGEKNNNPFGIWTGDPGAGKDSFTTSNGLNKLGPAGCGKPGNKGNNGYSPPKTTEKCSPGFFAGDKGNAPTMKSSTPTGNKLLDRATVMASKIKISSGIDVSVQLLMAFIMVESNGRRASRTLVRFEPHCFLSTSKRKRSWARPDLRGQIPYTPRGYEPASYISKTKTETNRVALDRAYKLDPVAALRSTSFGSFQVMGVWLLKLFDNDPLKALAAYDKNPNKISDEMAVLWWTNELKRNRFKKAIAARPHDFVTIARHYNGAGQKYKYGAKLKKLFAQFDGVAIESVSTPPPPTATSPCSSEPVSSPASESTAAAAIVPVDPPCDPTVSSCASPAYSYWTNLIIKAGGKLDDTGNLDTTIPTVVGIRGISVDSGGNFVRHDRSYQRSRNRGKDKGYRDFFMVIKDGAVSGPFVGNTRPSFGFGKFGVDPNRDGVKDVGMLRPNTYRAIWMGYSDKYQVTTWRASRKDAGDKHLSPPNLLPVSGWTSRGKGYNKTNTWRDTGEHKSYIWNELERAESERRGDLSTSVMFHNGSKTNPNSAGCQTMWTPVYKNFHTAVGDTSFWYTLIDDTANPIGDPIV